MATMTGGAALIAALAVHDVDTVFGIPGTHNLAAYAAMPEHSIRHISPRHEQGAGYAADGYARTTGRVGVVLTTTGPAILNTSAAAAQAYSDSVPVLFISPGVPSDHPARGNGLLHEVRDQRAAMEAVVGNSLRVATVAEIPLAVGQCFALMTAGRPRPVHLEIPLDLLDTAADVSIAPRIPAPSVTASQDVIAAATDALARASAPALIVGGGAMHAAEHVRQIAERLGAPVLASTNGKGIVPEDHRLAVGAGPQHPSAVKAIADADLVLAIGTELAPADWWLGLPNLAGKLVRIDIDATAVATNATPAHALVGDATLVLDAVLENLPQADASEAAVARAEQIRTQMIVEARTDGEPWLPLMEAIAAAIPRDMIIASDNAMVSYYGALSNLPVYRPGGFLFPTGAGTLGYGLPAGIGAKIAHPDAPVVVLQGDGGVMFTIAELAMAAELGLALPVIIVDNGGYGEIHNEMADRADPVHAVALGRPDFAALARSLGCYGTTLTGASDSSPTLKDELSAALAADRPTVLHVYEGSRAASSMRP